MTVANNRGDSALHNAARWNHAPLVQVLMLYGAQYKATNNEEKTPLDLTKVGHAPYPTVHLSFLFVG